MHVCRYIYIYMNKLNYSYLVEESSLSTKLEASKDRKGVAVEGGNATSTWVVNVSTFRVADVVFQPECTQGFLNAIVSSLLPPFFSFIILAFWAYQTKLILCFHDSTPPIIKAL